MTRSLLSLLALLLCSGPSLAQEQGPQRRLAILADFSDRSQFAVENRLFSALEKLEQSGSLAGVGIEGSPLIINTGQADGESLLKSWNLSKADLPVLAITKPSAQSSPALLWYWQVPEVPTAISALEAELGINSSAALPVIRAADFTPRTGPLAAGTNLRLTLQGTPGCSARAEVGAVSDIPLFELESGLYRGDYVVKPDDRTDAVITLVLTNDGGASVSRLVGHVLLQGVQAPDVQSARQISTGEWMVTGTAPPNSQVTVTAVVSQSFIFKFKSTNTFTGMADANGQFQLKAFIEENIAGSEATFTSTATLRNVSETSQQKLTFQGLRNPPKIPSPGNPTFTPWSLAGRWYHGNRATSIRVSGADSVVIRNEYGQETTLFLVWPNRLESRGSTFLRGRVEGQTIFWDNGTRWNRNR